MAVVMSGERAETWRYLIEAEEGEGVSFSSFVWETVEQSGSGHEFPNEVSAISGAMAMGVGPAALSGA